MIRQEDVFPIGKITKAHGLKGEVNFMFTNDTWDRDDCNYLICDIDGILVPFYIEEYRFKSDNVALVKFEDLDSVETVEFLIGCDVYLEKKYAEDEESDEMPLNYFIGFKVVDGDKCVGTITDIDDSTQNWLFIIEKEDGSEAMIPAHEDFIVALDKEKRVITVDLPQGLI